MTDQKKISIIIPCFNEEKFIDGLIENLLEQDYPHDMMEIIFADGRSTDLTRRKISEFQMKHSCIRIVDNPYRVVPHALNLAIRASIGDIVIRMDAHSIYPFDYCSKLVGKLFEHKADNVGGTWITEPGSDTIRARAIVMATSHPLGIGNARYRLGASQDVEADTVPYGCFNREIFDRIGYFDEHMLRNQDDEFNGRIRKNGGKIFLIPSIGIKYFARENFSKLWRMFYQYGLFKPLVNIKLGAPATMRQFAPPIFVLALFVLLTAGLFYLPVFCGFLVVVASYFIAVAFVSFKLSRGKGLKMLLNILAAFPVVHFAYGFGYIFGLVKFTMLHDHLRMKPADLKENR